MGDILFETFFVGFAFLSQIFLALNFASRNWKPSLERKYGWVVYALGIPAALLGVYYWVNGVPWHFTIAPILFSTWALYGYYVDIIREINWRSPPTWPVFIPYVTLYMASQFSFWIPLWSIGLGYWIAFSMLYILNTSLNLYSHRKIDESIC